MVETTIDSEAKTSTRTGKVGEAVEVREGATVRWPDHVERVVTGGLVTLDRPGTFVIDGVEVTAS